MSWWWMKAGDKFKCEGKDEIFWGEGGGELQNMPEEEK